MYADNWKAVLRGDAQEIIEFLSEMRPLCAHATLLPYIEAYGIVAEELERLEPDAGIAKEACVQQSLKYGQQRYLQRRISSKESIAKLLFENGYKLFSNYGLTEAGDASISARRAAVSHELGELSDRLARIRTISRSAHVKRQKRSVLRAIGE